MTNTKRKIMRIFLSELVEGLADIEEAQFQIKFQKGDIILVQKSCSDILWKGIQICTDFSVKLMLEWVKTKKCLYYLDMIKPNERTICFQLHSLKTEGVQIKKDKTLQSVLEMFGKSLYG